MLDSRGRRRTTRLLHLDSSGGVDAVSRTLGRELVAGWCARDPGTVLTYRDLVAQPVDLVTPSWVAAAQAPAERRTPEDLLALACSDRLIAELEAADVLVLGAPMYNFGVPAALKARVDQVVRVGRTFVYDGPRPRGTLRGKRALVVATSGGDATQYAALGLDFRTAYLRAILGFTGITEVAVLSVEDTLGGCDLDAVRAELEVLLDREVLAARTHELAAAGASAPAQRPLVRSHPRLR